MWEKQEPVSRDSGCFPNVLMGYAIVCCVLFVASFFECFIKVWYDAAAAGTIPFGESKGGIEIWMGLTVMANFFSGMPLILIGIWLRRGMFKRVKTSGKIALIVSMSPTIALYTLYASLTFPLTFLFYPFSWLSLILVLVALGRASKRLLAKGSEMSRVSTVERGLRKGAVFVLLVSGLCIARKEGERVGGHEK